MRPVSKALICLFAGIGFADVFVRLLLWPLTSEIYGYKFRLPSDVEIVSIVQSADRSVKAIVYRWTGTGLNPGCGEFISVLKGTSSDTTGWGADNKVFENDNCVGDIHVKWEAATDTRNLRLRIDADPAKATLMSRFALGGTVKVAYPNDP